MKKAILFTGMVCMATTAMAFGGGGSGHDSTKYNRHNPGVDNFGVHIHPDNPPLDIRFYDIKMMNMLGRVKKGRMFIAVKKGMLWMSPPASVCLVLPALWPPWRKTSNAQCALGK